MSLFEPPHVNGVIHDVVSDAGRIKLKTPPASYDWHDTQVDIRTKYAVQLNLTLAEVSALAWSRVIQKVIVDRLLDLVDQLAGETNDGCVGLNQHN